MTLTLRGLYLKSGTRVLNVRAISQRYNSEFTQQKSREANKKMNVNFEYSKTLAGEGAVLLLLSLIPYVGWVLGIVGVVLLAKAMKEFSYYYQDESIYSNAWKGLKYYIVAIMAAAVAVASIVVGAASATQMFAGDFTFTAGFVAGLAVFLAGLGIAFVFYVLGAVNLRNSLNTIAKKSGENNLRTAGTLLLIGAALTILFGIGLLLIPIAWIFLIIGFFSMKSHQSQQYTQYNNGYTTTEPNQTVQTSPSSTTVIKV